MDVRPKRKETAHRAHAPHRFPCLDRQEPGAKRSWIAERVATSKGDLESDLDDVLRLGLVQSYQAGGRKEHRAVLGEHVADSKLRVLFGQSHRRQTLVSHRTCHSIEGGRGRFG